MLFNLKEANRSLNFYAFNHHILYYQEYIWPLWWRWRQSRWSWRWSSSTSSTGAPFSQKFHLGQKSKKFIARPYFCRMYNLIKYIGLTKIELEMDNRTKTVNKNKKRLSLCNGSFSNSLYLVISASDPDFFVLVNFCFIYVINSMNLSFF